MLAEKIITPNILKNSSRNTHSALITESATNAAIGVISKWKNYKPTPLVNLAPEKYGVDKIYYKDEDSRFGLHAFKALGGAYALWVHYHNSAQSNKIVYTSATAGNHGKSVAWGAQMVGAEAIIYIGEYVSDGRKKALEQYGATVVRAGKTYDDCVKICAEDAAKHGRVVISDTSYDGYTEIPRVVMEGYTVMAAEAWQQMPADAPPTHIFLQGGVGSFAAAMIDFFRIKGSTAKFIIVEPENAACIYSSAINNAPTVVHGSDNTIMGCLACGEVSLIAWDILQSAADYFMTIPDEYAVKTMKLLAENKIIAGESGAAGLAGFIYALEHNLLAELEINTNSRLLFFGTEGLTDPDSYSKLTAVHAN